MYSKLDAKGNKMLWPPQLNGIVIAYYPVAPGLNPKHNIYAFCNLHSSNYIIFI